MPLTYLGFKAQRDGAELDLLITQCEELAKELMEQVANATAAHHHRAYGYKSALAGRAPALAAITRGLGMVAARLNAQLVLRRLVYVGDGPHAEEAVRRRGGRASGRACGRTLSITGRTPARALVPERAVVASWLLLISFPLESAQ